MDLVDIDKVLDDFEEHEYETIQRTNDESNMQIHDVIQKDRKQSQVRNVFTSLNEYVEISLAEQQPETSNNINKSTDNSINNMSKLCSNISTGDHVTATQFLILNNCSGHLTELTMDNTSNTKDSYDQLDDQMNDSHQVSIMANDVDYEFNLGEIAPYWVPDTQSNKCMRCAIKFSIIRRRHHCRACGQLLCSNCCSERRMLSYMDTVEIEHRVCLQCADQLDLIKKNYNKSILQSQRSPNPNKPSEYCNVGTPTTSVENDKISRSPSLMVPVSVLKSVKSVKNNKTVTFSDGLRPGCDLLERTENEKIIGKFNSIPQKFFKDTNIQRGDIPVCLVFNDLQRQYIQMEEHEIYNSIMKKKAILRFCLHANILISVKWIKLDCCVNRSIINFTTIGFSSMGQDEIIYLIEVNEDEEIKSVINIIKELIYHLYQLYERIQNDNYGLINELSITEPESIDKNFLGSPKHGGFLYIRPSFQCMDKIILPKTGDRRYLIGLLIHRTELIWGRILPLRLILRLGALFRYYPTIHISILEREPVYSEIAQTIVNLLADFQTFTYTIRAIRGMKIHMGTQDKIEIFIPKRQHAVIISSIYESSDNLLAFAASFSSTADGHLVCIQNCDKSDSGFRSYSTQAINIQGHPRNVTGATFVVFNGALKTGRAKCSIIEDGLMIHLQPAKLKEIRNYLLNQKDCLIRCEEEIILENQKNTNTEIISIKWIDTDCDFNIGVSSPIDGKKFDGVSSLRIHRNNEFKSSKATLYWTEVFIINGMSDGQLRRTEGNKENIEANVYLINLIEEIGSITGRTLQSIVCHLVNPADIVRRIGIRFNYALVNEGSYEAGIDLNTFQPDIMKILDFNLIGILHNSNIDAPLSIEFIFHLVCDE